MRTAVEKAKPVRPDIKLGICGEHGGDPESVKFCHRIGLNYVSCSPFRVPVARLAAAQAAMEEKAKKRGCVERRTRLKESRLVLRSMLALCGKPMALRLPHV